MAYRDSTDISGNTNSLTVAAPAGLAENDVITLFWVNGGSNASTITWPSGFTEIANASVGSPDTKTIKVARKVAGASEPANYTVTSSTSDFCTLKAIAHSGRDTGASAYTVQTTTNTTNAASPVSVDATGLTAASGDDILWLAAAVSADAGIWTYTPPTNYTEQEDSGAASYTSSTVATRDNVSAGATGTLSGTQTRAGASGGYGAVVIAYPAAGGGGSARPTWYYEMLKKRRAA